MNTEVIVHPRLQYYGLVAATLDARTEWYGKVPYHQQSQLAVLGFFDRMSP